MFTIMRPSKSVSSHVRQALCSILLLSLLSSSLPAAPQTTIAVVSDLSTSFSFWLRRSGLSAKLRQGPGKERAAGARQEKQEDRNARIARVEISPGDVTVQVDEHVAFAAVAFDQEGNALGGARVKWSCLDEGRGKAASISQRGDFEATVPGKFRVTAETEGGKRASVQVSVREGAKRRRGEKLERTAPVSTRDLPPSAPAQPRGEKRGERSFSHAPRQRKLKKASDSYAAAATPAALAATALPMDGWDSTNYWSADDPVNTRGNPPGGAQDDGAGNGNFQAAAPVLSLPGRGIDMNLGLVYNSRVWNKADSQISFDIDRDWPAPGWSLGFGKIVGLGVDKGSMIIEPDGTRHSYVGSVYYDPNWNYTDFTGHTVDGSFIDYSHHTGLGGAMVSARATYPNGTVIEYGAQGVGAMYPTRITDPNGNYITITYVNNQGPRIQTVTDTLNRLISFHYDDNGLLTAVTAPGLGGEARTLVRLHYTTLALSPSFSGLTPAVRNWTPQVIDAIYFPSTGTGYWFADADSYSPYGMLTKVVEQRGMGLSASTLNEQGSVTPGAMTRQQVYDFQYDNLTDAPTYTSMTETWTRDGVSTDQAVTSYEVHENSSPRTVAVTLPNGLKNIQYSYNAPGQFNDGLTYLDETRDANNTLLQSSTSAWQQGAYDSPRPTRIESTDELGQMTATEFSYGPVYNQVTETRNYDYGGQALLKVTRTQYENSASYTSRHIFNLVKAAEVYTSDGATRVSRTEYQYDGQPLADAPGVVMHDERSNPHAPVFEHPGRCYYDYNYYNYYDNYYCEPDYTTSEYNSATDYRGNVTQITTYANAGTEPASGAITESRRYDITGNLVEASTSCCQQTSVVYTSATQYAYPTSQTRGSSDPNSPVHVTQSATYDFSTGLMLSSTDAQGRLSQNVYTPDTLRTQTAYSPTGAYLSYAYDEVGLSVTETLHTADGAVADQDTKLLDGRGQVRQYRSLGAGGLWSMVDVRYDIFGHITQQSLPYRNGEQIQWGTTTYDVMGRVVSQQAPDGSTSRIVHNETPRPAAASSAPGQTTKVIDAWGREHWGRTDSSDRPVEIVEPEPNGDGTVATGGFRTTYSYDTPGNLVKVEQGVQTRAFRYDSLGRMTHQKLAEASATLDDLGRYSTSGGTWSDIFTYDDRSNLISRVDARGVKSLFNYNDDPLNRLQSVSFSTAGFGDTAHPVVDAPSVSYAYMTTGDITRLSSVTTAGVSTDAFTYDVEGRLATRTQTFVGRSGYAMVTDYLYDSLDRITDIRYPAEYGTGAAPRKVVHQDYELASLLGSLKVDGADYASQITYNAASQSTALKIGASGANQLTESYAYNAQTGLLENQRVERGAERLLDLSYDYAGANGKRTGQLVKITNNLDASRSRDRSFAYDALGRLVQARGGSSSAPRWTQSYSYDRYGNRLSVTATGSLASLGASDAQQQQEQTAPTALLAANTSVPTTDSVRAEAMSAVSDSPFSIFSSTRSNSGRARAATAAQPVIAAQPSSDIVISQIYGGGGNSGATLKNDFIELFNRGTTSVDLAGWSVQYAPAGSANWQVTRLSGSLAPGQYFLVQEAQGTGGTTALPTPNASGQIEMNATAGKVALVNDSTPLAEAAPATAQSIVDLVGYGASAGYFEGSGAAPAPNNTTADLRASQGCIETDNNATDFDGGTPLPRNTATPTHACASPASSTTVLISEFRTRGSGGSNDEFIELYNKSDAAINLSGWKIKASNNAGAVTTRMVIAQGTTLPARAHFLVTNAGSGGYTGAVAGNQSYSTGIADDGGIALTRSDDVIVDQVGMSAGSAFKENRTLAPLTANANQSYERKPGGANASTQDTDDSPSDFQLRTPSDPRNLSSAPPPPPANQPPLAVTGGPYSGTTSAPVDFNGSNSTDPDGTITSYAWDFGDGTTATGATPQHTYTSAGNYTARLTVTDNQNAQASATVAVNITGGGGGGEPPPSSPTSLSYDETSNRIRTTGYDYDAAGNLTRSQSSAGGAWQRYQYDAAGRLVNVRNDSNQIIASYTYGAGNHRLISTEGTLQTYYVWGGDATTVEYTEDTLAPGALQWSKSYVYLGARLLATLQPNNQGSESTQFHHPDLLGTRLITNAQDTSVQEQVTLPFGTALEAESTGGTNRRFTSYDRSMTTGLDYAVNRNYDSLQGRFTQVDPLGMSAASLTDPQSLNLYAYCGNDPVNRVDPSGLFWGKLFRWIGRGISKLFKVATKVAMKLLANKWVQLLIGVVILTLASPFAPIFFAELGAGEGLISYMTASLLITGLQTAGAVSSHVLEQRKRRRRGRGERRRAVRLSGAYMELFKLARARALQLLNDPNSDCYKFLISKGFTPGEISKAAQNLKDHVPYDALKSTNMEDFGGFSRPVNKGFEELRSRSQNGQYPNAATGSLSRNTYYTLGGLKTSVEIHETFHRILDGPTRVTGAVEGIGDDALKGRLGINDPPGASSESIDKALEDGGCK
ncbi:MAG TPA: lamin tail domain-containing protein [Pyrinomonadaceae bacterium]|jgi:RHS repeat-associated protein